MKSVIASLVAVAGMSVAANAVINTHVDMLVSADGSNFGPSVEFGAGTGLHKVEVLVRFTYIPHLQNGQPIAALGLASANFQPTVSNWGATDVAGAFANGGAGGNTTTPSGVVADAPGAYGRISPFGRTALTTSQAITAFVHTGGAGGAPAGTWLRIAQKQVTSWIGGSGNTSGASGVNIAQLANVGRTASDPAFNPSLSVNVFRFSITIDAGGNSSFTRADLVVDAPLNGFGNRVSTSSTSFPDSQVGDREVTWWSDLNSGTGENKGTAEVSSGLIRIVPAPASIALLGLGGLCVARRRR